MRRGLMIVACGLLAVLCCKASEGRSSRRSLANLNQLKLKSTGASNEILFEGKARMKTAVILELSGNPYLFMWREGGGCDSVNKMAGLRVSVAFNNLSLEEKNGKKPLPKSLKPSNGVILTKGFNRVIMAMGRSIGTITFRSGTIKPGSTITGTIDLKDDHAYIKGNFKAKVCPRKR